MENEWGQKKMEVGKEKGKVRSALQGQRLLIWLR